MERKIIIGIDPGSESGAMAWNTFDTTGMSTLRFKDVTPKEFCLKIKELSPYFVTVEKVHTFPMQGISSAGKFMENFGMIKGFLMALDIPYSEVTPQTWMKYYGLKREKEQSRTEWKKVLRQRAEELYPYTKIVTETADAILIAHYAKVQLAQQQLQPPRPQVAKRI